MKKDYILPIIIVLVILILSFVMYTIVNLNQRWNSGESNRQLLRESYSLRRSLSIEDLIKNRKPFQKGFYGFTQDDIAVIREYEENQRLQINEINAAQKLERQELVEEISMIISIITILFAIVGIGLPLLSFSVARDDLREERKKFSDEKEKYDLSLGELKEKVGGVGKDLQIKEELIKKGFEIAQQAQNKANMVTILSLRFKLGSLFDKRLYEEVMRDGNQRKLLIYAIKDVTSSLKEIINDKDQYSIHKDELIKALTQLSLDIEYVLLLPKERAEKDAIGEMFTAIEIVCSKNLLIDEFWKQVEIIKCCLEKYGNTFADVPLAA